MGPSPMALLRVLALALLMSASVLAQSLTYGVGRAPTEAVVRSSLAILVSNFFLSFGLNIVFPTI